MHRNSICARWLGGFLACLAPLCLNAQPLIISDGSHGIYEQLVKDVFEQYQEDGIEPIIYALDQPHSAPSQHELSLIDEVVSIGSGAMKAIFEYKSLEVPSLSLLTTKESYLEQIAENPRDAALRSVIYLNQPLNRIVHVGKSVFEDPVEYIIFDNKRFQQQRDIIHQQVITYKPLVDNTVIKAIRNLDSTPQKAIIALPSHTAFTPITIKNTLISAYKAQIPIIGYSQSFTQAGALFSVHSDVERLPDEVRLWRESRHRQSQRASRYYIVSINHQIARSLDIELAPKWQKERVHLEGSP